MTLLHRSAPPAGRTLTLLGLLAAGGVLLALAGFVLPETPEAPNPVREDRSRDLLDRLERAIRCFAEDTGRLPASLRDLVDPTCVFRGWCGPYLSEPYDQAPPGIARPADADGFGSAVAWNRLGPTLGALQSPGPNHVWNDGDDLVRRCDLRAALRGETLRRIVVVNGAIRRYLTFLHPRGPSLTGSASQILGRLRSGNALDKDPAWNADAWGDPLVRDPHPIRVLGSPPRGSWQKATSSNL